MKKSCENRNYARRRRSLLYNIIMNYSEFSPALARNIKFYRLQCGLSQSALAALLSVSQDTVSLWARGKSAHAAAYLPYLAAVFDVSIEELFFN